MESFSYENIQSRDFDKNLGLTFSGRKAYQMVIVSVKVDMLLKWSTCEAPNLKKWNST